MTQAQPRTQGAHHVGLTVPDLGAAQAFFEGALGFRKVGERPGYPAVFVSDGTLMITLWQARDPASALPFDRKRHLGLHHLALRVADHAALDALHRELAARDDVRVEFAPEPLGAGPARHMMCAIPGGIRLELLAAGLAMADASPFHAGEKLVQERLGVRDVEVWARRALRPFLLEQHQEFYARQPFVIVAARDGAGRPWATLIAGREGFAASPDPRSLTIDGGLAAGDALEGSLLPGADVGVLGIELATRRRNRVNGRLAGGEGPFRLLVRQSFGNCPQHIHPRSLQPVERSPGAPRRGERLAPSQRRWLGSADTFFIASGYRGEGDDASFGMDASHRGGPPGFVVVEGEARISFPDYAGNNLFNTMGNLLLDPRVGLLFVDWATGGLLQLTGRATIDFEPADRERFPGARRVVSVDIDGAVELPAAVPLGPVDGG